MRWAQDAIDFSAGCGTLWLQAWLNNFITSDANSCLLRGVINILAEGK